VLRLRVAARVASLALVVMQVIENAGIVDVPVEGEAA
jgi:hypothetical protein